MNKYVEALKDIAAMNNDISNQEGVYSIIAGGAARDVDFKKPFKDVDIFIVMDTDDALKMARIQDYYDNYFVFLDRVDPDNPYEENLNDIYLVEDYAFDRYDTRFPVQIIFQKSQNTGDPLNEITSKFDLGVCQIAFKNENDQFKMVKSEQYKQDKADRTVRLSPFGLELPTQERKRKTRERAHRIAGKLGCNLRLNWPEDIRAREQQQLDFGRALGAFRAEQGRLAAERVVYVNDVGYRPYWQAINNPIGGR